MPHRWLHAGDAVVLGCRYDNDGAGEMLNPSSAAGHHRRSVYCAVFAASSSGKFEVTIVGGRIDDCCVSLASVSMGVKPLRSVYPEHRGFMSCTMG
ncbi:hypothetical protein KCP78_25000 [Salmonella enterica subsp. enterica]|nr:hypothetical protein KCP78_25000 [Salmonella enterica subsp. enterica]